MALLGLCALATSPYLFVAGPDRLLAGLPLWLWWSLSCTLALSILIAWGVWRYWRDDDA
jgi:membrane protein implicated in regulation of membrane protease activity